MAGNIVKWWKHKILGGYKQFSVLQECTTDSEELIYPTRAPSSCSAPPDLLLISDRETTSQLTKSPNIISSQGDHLREQLVNLTPKVDNTENNHHSNIAAETQIRDKNHENAERMRLEEFTCDVTCESGKSSQPLQFSFTFYDLDGHHGKITKDDIAGIVYTIYESIGKSVVVPHCGSKTINVRLTVSPESKSTGKAKKISGASLAAQSRRQHRYRPRKLIKSDDEECEAESGGSDKETPNNLSKRGPTTSKCHKPNVEADINQKDCCFDPRVSGEHQQSPSNTATTAAVTIATSHTIVGQPSNSEKSPAHQSVIATVAGCKFPATENVYESVGNLKCCSKDYRKTEALECKECAQQNSILNTQQQQQQQIKHSARAAKLLRKARKQKYQDQCHESRQRSLSVGNESCWKSGTKRTSQGDDGGHKGPSTECWNNALKRNDLIDIIRESMEKNRLCFQSNGKTANNESPIRHRHRSHTVSKVTDENYPPGPQTSHHIPIYHQQLAINPAIMTHHNALHPKANLCGYDSFLHATICSANNSPSSVLVPSQPTIKSPKNCVNSANLTKSSKLPKTGYHSQQNSPQFHGYQRLSANHGYPKLNTTLLNSLNPQLSAEEKLNRTIDHVEKWLNERDQTIIKANDVKLLKYGRDEGKIRKDEKNYDNFLHSKLAEKLGESPRKLNNNQNSNKHLANNRDATQNHVHNYHLKQRLIHSPTSHSDRGNTSTSKFVTLIPVNVDPIECENLIHTTSDEENISPKSANGNITVNSDGCGSAASGSGGEGGGGGNGGGESCASNQGNNSNSSSMVHHYVHEHIHHHYHHFENKED